MKITKQLDREGWERHDQQAALVKSLWTALADMMVGQKFDGGGHIVERVRPTHSAVLKAKMLLDSLDSDNEKNHE